MHFHSTWSYRAIESKTRCFVGRCLIRAGCRNWTGQVKSGQHFYAEASFARVKRLHKNVEKRPLSLGLDFLLLMIESSREGGIFFPRLRRKNVTFFRWFVRWPDKSYPSDLRNVDSFCFFQPLDPKNFCADLIWSSTVGLFKNHISSSSQDSNDLECHKKLLLDGVIVKISLPELAS